MKKSGYKIWLYSKHMGWNMARVIYTDEVSGSNFVKINGGYVSLAWCKSMCDDYYEDTARGFC